MKKKYPVFLFFMLILLVWSCQNQDSSATDETEVSSESTLGAIPESAKIDSNWVRLLQGNWVLEENTMSTIEISGNTYSDQMDGTTNGTFKIEYSGTCIKCQSSLNLGDNRCLVLFNLEDETVSTCLLISGISETGLSIINTNHPEKIYKYTRK